MIVIICPSGVPHGGGFAGRCAECGARCWADTGWRSLTPQADFCCIGCANELFRQPHPKATLLEEVHALDEPVPGSVGARLYICKETLPGVAPSMDWHDFDPELGEFRDPDRSHMGSPLWVKCPRCASARGTECRMGRERFCHQRIEANRERLEALETWAAPWETPCHQAEVWLVWRSASTQVRWQGVPCFKCGHTFEIEKYTEDLAGVRIPAPRVNPQLLEMACWASTESDPWQRPTSSRSGATKT